MCNFGIIGITLTGKDSIDNLFWVDTNSIWVSDSIFGTPRFECSTEYKRLSESQLMFQQHPKFYFNEHSLYQSYQAAVAVPLTYDPPLRFIRLWPPWLDLVSSSIINKDKSLTTSVTKACLWWSTQGACHSGSLYDFWRNTQVSMSVLLLRSWSYQTRIHRDHRRCGMCGRVCRRIHCSLCNGRVWIHWWVFFHSFWDVSWCFSLSLLGTVLQ